MKNHLLGILKWLSVNNSRQENIQGGAPDYSIISHNEIRSAKRRIHSRGKCFFQLLSVNNRKQEDGEGRNPELNGSDSSSHDGMHSAKRRTIYNSERRSHNDSRSHASLVSLPGRELSCCSQASRFRVQHIKQL